MHSKEYLGQDVYRTGGMHSKKYLGQKVYRTGGMHLKQGVLYTVQYEGHDECIAKSM